MSNKESSNTTTVAYARVTSNAEDDLKKHDHVVGDPVEMAQLPLASVALDHPAYNSVPRQYAHIPETKGLFWADDFFLEEMDNYDDDIVAVFDFDYEAKEEYYSKFGWTCYGATVCCFPGLFGLSLLALVPCHLRSNVSWAVRSQHVAITRDGIRFVQEKRPTCWGASCTDAGRTVKTIPFDQITDCNVVEAAGRTLAWIPNTLHEVHIDTASSNNRSEGKCGHDLTLVGLKDPNGFQRLVWAMKRHQRYSSNTGLPVATTTGSAMDRGQQVVSALFNGTTTSSADPQMLELLQDIRQELRDLREQNKSSTGSAPTSTLS